MSESVPESVSVSVRDRTTTAGAAIVRQLEALGVRRAYGVPGESYLGVLDALHDSPVEFVVCRHEGGAGFMALAEARLTGVPGVVMVTRGPGAANAAIAVHTAWQDATPLVLLVGVVRGADRDRESFQEWHRAGQPGLRRAGPLLRRLRRAVSTIGDLAPALDRALGAGRAAVLHLDVDPAQLEPLW